MNNELVYKLKRNFDFEICLQFETFQLYDENGYTFVWLYIISIVSLLIAWRLVKNKLQRLSNSAYTYILGLV